MRIRITVFRNKLATVLHGRVNANHIINRTRNVFRAKWYKPVRNTDTCTIQLWMVDSGKIKSIGAKYLVIVKAADSFVVVAKMLVNLDLRPHSFLERERRKQKFLFATTLCCSLVVREKKDAIVERTENWEMEDLKKTLLEGQRWRGDIDFDLKR